ncbi:MAG: MMPL family transporter [Pseudomonadota bacterium]|nr:MMPL family transporter [Pseudomonadota bacterium]
MQQSLAEQYAHRVIRWRWLIVIGAIAVVLLMASGGRFLHFDNDYRIFFGEENPQLLAFENLQDTYTKNDNVLLVLAPKDGHVFTPQILAAVQDITDRAWQTPYSLRVDSITNFQHTSAVGDDLTVADLVEEPLQLSAADLERIRQIALAEPMLINRLISPRSHVTALNIVVELPGEDMTREVPEVVASVRDLKSYIATTYPHIDVYLTGLVMMNNAFPEASQWDMQHLMPLALLLIMGMVFLQLRGFGGTLGTLLVTLFAILGAMGLAGWSGIALSPPVMSAPVIILTLGVADCVHILTNWMQGVRHGVNKQDAMVESLRINLMPIFLTSITTAVGFLTLNFSDAPPFHDLGNISVFGVLLAYVLSVLFLPALMMILPLRVKQGTRSGTHLMERFSEWVIRHQKRLLPGMGIAILLLVLLAPFNVANDVYVHYFDDKIEFRTDTDFALQNLTGMYYMDFSLDSKEESGISRPEFMHQVEQFTDWLRQQPEVIHVSTITDTFKRLNKNLHGDDPDWQKLPRQRDLAAQYLLLYEMSLPYGLDLNNQIDIEKRATRVSVTMKTISSVAVLDVEQRVHQWLQTNTPEILTWGSSPTVMFAHIGMNNIRSMMIGTIVALVVISLILIIALRSLRYGLVSLIPNLAPAGMAFGLWALIDGEIGLSLSVVAAMTLGIVVDDTVHFLSKYLRARREQGLNAEDAVRYSFKTVGVALWITSLALIAGFLVLSTSSFELNAGMGVMTSIIIAFALLADFLLLPPLLIRVDGWLNPTD